MKLKRLGIILLIALATVVAFQYLQSEPTIETAYRECELCGLERREVKRMIHNSLTSRLTREQQIEAYQSTAMDGDDTSPCMPCVTAVLDLMDEMREDMP